jgi:uncharacterized membrane protein (UPF0127 family)
MKYRGIFSIVILLITSCYMCGGSSDRTNPKQSVPSEAQEEERVSGLSSDLVSIRVGGISAQVETAKDPNKRERGLMFREHLPENQGMLFVFPNEQILSFWMRNTLIPLDIAFIDHGGIIVSVQHMQPLDDENYHVSPKPVQYALEMNLGWFARNRVRVGDRVDF